MKDLGIGGPFLRTPPIGISSFFLGRAIFLQIELVGEGKCQLMVLWTMIIPFSNIAGWWFGTCFIFPYIGNNNPN